MSNSRDRSTQDLVEVVKSMKSLDRELETLRAQVNEKEKALHQEKLQVKTMQREDSSPAELPHLQQQVHEVKQRFRDSKKEKKAAREAVKANQVLLEEKSRELASLTAQLENERATALRLKKETQDFEEAAQAREHEAAVLRATPSTPPQNAQEEAQQLTKEIETLHEAIKTQTQLAEGAAAIIAKLNLVCISLLLNLFSYYPALGQIIWPRKHQFFTVTGTERTERTRIRPGQE